ncbi:MAG: glutamine--tRNA ligase/YqeY domain fusion protein [Nitrospira sp.]|nr:glutamine--tRNA ligase/YqeY domain fusion protein [Nitrospira sp.]MDH4370647.1 glutamine--tRNA ligase/YqeY domain fusion protein [Nitrospira sp.]MDH5348567.1 glutamine--tRNA ligase/YqeY domain fusion protein [Nitrospira sp.]MDH5496969.1 glutamine--tRNA ligase/YqeY domain fusion protein [Nitrospira sp.]
MASESTTASNFVRDIVSADRASGKHGGRVVTRFPPEPNGYLHIGHAKSIVLNFGMANETPVGICHLRFDDTNPTTEDPEYVQAIQEDVQWLGFDWNGKSFYASDYFEQLYAFAIVLIQKGKAYVDSLSSDHIREYRGTLTEPGRNSPFRTRSVEENLDLFARMRAGEFTDGTHVLRAAIDMGSPNINLRDPILYRIRHAIHYRTGTTWCIYPSYDFAHPLSDAIEGITHSLCTLEFEDHRPLYDWVVAESEAPHRPQQIEFARLNLTSTVMSKRKLLELVTKKLVAGWDDPRLPTLKGLRRRGVTPEAIRAFCDHIGVAKRDAIVEMQLLEHFIREDLNKRSPRVMAVLRPLKVVIDNYPEGVVEELDAVNNPEDVAAGTRKVPFSRTLYIDQDDFREDPPKQFYRLAPGREVRLRYGYIIQCVSVTKDPHTGAVTELHCTYDPKTRSGSAHEQRKVKATIHWVSALHALKATVRLYYPLLLPDEAKDQTDRNWTYSLNPQSLETLSGCLVEPSLGSAAPGSRFQFERQGYFCVDLDSLPESLLFNRTVSLKDAWARVEKTQPTPRR